MSLTTVDRVKEYLGTVEAVDSQFDPLLERLISSCSADFEGATGRVLASTARTETKTGNGKTTLLLDHYPVTAVASVTVDGAVVTATIAERDAGILSCANGFTKGAEVVVTYTAGYAEIPEDVKQAVDELVMIRWQDRTHGSAAYQAVGGQIVDYRSGGGVGGLLAHINSVIERYKRPGLG